MLSGPFPPTLCPSFFHPLSLQALSPLLPFPPLHLPLYPPFLTPSGCHLVSSVAAAQSGTELLRDLEQKPGKQICKKYVPSCKEDCYEMFCCDHFVNCQWPLFTGAEAWASAANFTKTIQVCSEMFMKSVLPRILATTFGQMFWQPLVSTKSRRGLKPYQGNGLQKQITTIACMLPCRFVFRPLPLYPTSVL